MAGTLSETLSIVQIALADQVVQHDMDTSPIGDPVGLISGINIIYIPSDPTVTGALAAAVASEGVPFERGTVASGDQFINNAEKKNWIRDTFGAIACEMEGAAIGHVCYVSGVDFVVIRCISDNASGEADMEYPELVGKAAVRSQKLVEAIVKEIG